MNKFCSNCGTELGEGVNVCPKCGTSVNSSVNQSTPVLTKRNIVTAIILSLITCGIYSIYWFVVMTNDSNKVSGEDGPTGGMAFLFTLLTCGIYSFYWNYKMGQKLAKAGKLHGKDINDNSVLYLILCIFGLGIVNYCLIQSDLNKFGE